MNQNKKGGKYHDRTLRNREHEILFMDLRRWTENPVKNEGKKKVFLDETQIQKAADIYHTWQSEGTDGAKFAVPELYKSVKTRKWIEEDGSEGLSVEQQSWSLIPSKYIEFVDHDLDIDFHAEMTRIQHEMREVMATEKQSQKLLEDAFRGIGYEL